MNVRGRLPIAPLAIAGIVGPILFVLLVIAQGIAQPDYSHIAMPVSALTAWPAGWIQRLNFNVTGTLMAAFAIGLHIAIQPTRFGLVGIALLLVSSVGVFLAGVFPWINVAGVPTETPQHVVAAVCSFFGASTGLVALSRRMSADARWHDLAAYVLATGTSMFFLFIALGFFAIGDGTPLHRWAGLLQRVLVVVWFTCILVMARRMLTLSAAGWRSTTSTAC